MNLNTKRACLETSTSSTNTQLCSENLEDRISWLDENVLSKILSHLSTVEAVSTSVLSKAWRNIWTNVTELQFDDSSYRDPKDYRFTEFVERVLRDVGSPRINSFQLHSVNPYDETRLLSWLSKVLRRNLQKLVITGYESESVNLSPIFASLDSLVELRLHTSSILDISAPTVFPNLKYFSLEEARIFNMSSISHNLVLNFPVLETFAAYYCRFFKTDTLIIDSPLLKTFEVFKCSREHVPNPNEVFKISVSALKLEKVTFSGDGSQRIRLFFPPSLPYAYLSLSRRWSKKFLHSFTSVTCLGVEISKSFEVNEVPLFSQLVYLSLTYNLNDHKILRQFLESAPRLEMFSIRDKKTPRATLTTKSMKELRSETAPDCIRTMLIVLQIRDFKMHEPQVSMLRHVMENAEILRSVILTTSNPITEKAKARILSFPKASPHASVFFE